jgi:glycosyltransferase involved in cell wall biosynthesis
MTVKRVAVDLRMLGALPHGIARYALGIWNGLPALDDLHFTALCSEEGAPHLRLTRPGDAVVMARRPFLSLLEQVELPRLLAGIDLFHATSFSVPAFSALPLVLTLHDATHLALPEHASMAALLYHRTVVRRAARRAVRVLTSSEFSAGELLAHYGITRDRILIAPDAIDLAPAAPSAPRLPPGMSPERPYLLYVGNGKPHKNVEVLVMAHALLRDAPSLLLCGDGVQQFVGPNVHHLTDASDEELSALYRGAALFLFPSLMEGFGLPPLEAAACGAPVVLADGSALGEIWAGVAPLLPPHDPGRWAQTIADLLADDVARRALADRGAALAARFRSWQPAVDTAVAAYRLGLKLAR